MNKREVPIIVYDPPKGIRPLSWSVCASPLGLREKCERFKTKANAMRAARAIYNREPITIATGMKVPWAVTVSYSTTCSTANN